MKVKFLNGLLGFAVAGAMVVPAGNASLLAQAAPRTFSANDLPEMVVLGDVDPTLRKAQAIVNGDVITDTDIDQRLGLVLAANGGRVADEEKQRLRLQIIRNLIDEKLQLQEAAENDIRINEAEVTRSFERIAQNFKRTPAQFEIYLKGNSSSSNSLKAQIRAEMAWSRVLRRKVEPMVNVGDDEVQQVIDKLNAAKGKDEFHVGEIFLSATPETLDAVMQDASRIVGQVRGGASFVAYARQFSEASSAGLGGDLGWVRGEQLNSAVSTAVAALQPGQVTDAIPVTGGVAIMALIEKRQVLAADPLMAQLSLKQLTIPLKADTTEAQARAKVEEIGRLSQNMGGCGGVEALAQKVGGEVAVNDAVRMKDLPAQLQAILGRMSIGEATPAFGSAEEGLRVLVLCGRDDSQVQAKAPNFEEIYAQMNDERVNMRARRYLRDLRRDAIVDYR
ncbi:peptidylprolyl isomerase [Sandarakinorhabdus limnophila]|uniref:peptidylprolyl isomerase n=1 Tax=Sandarakinorhabdus limnophila TaxID=210512 RepID=UPI0026EF26F5|nr:peptidylprolyl isomerase [Sandarakinorhabdus limnophila]MCM0033613.1 peptidylprolyl isomerase [Sandarakinorhabdus limnophila]